MAILQKEVWINTKITEQTTIKYLYIKIPSLEAVSFMQINNCYASQIEVFFKYLFINDIEDQTQGNIIICKLTFGITLSSQTIHTVFSS